MWAGRFADHIGFGCLCAARFVFFGCSYFSLCFELVRVFSLLFGQAVRAAGSRAAHKLWADWAVPLPLQDQQAKISRAAVYKKALMSIVRCA